MDRGDPQLCGLLYHEFHFAALGKGLGQRNIQADILGRALFPEYFNFHRFSSDLHDDTMMLLSVGGHKRESIPRAEAEHIADVVHVGSLEDYAAADGRLRCDEKSGHWVFKLDDLGEIDARP